TPKISKIKYAYFLVLRKKSGVIIPKLDKNIITIGISNNNANGIIKRNINRKYLSTVNSSLNCPSFNDNKKGNMSLINIKYPNINPIRNKIKIAGMYPSKAFRSGFVSPGLINSQICKARIGNVTTTAIKADIIK